MSIRFAFAIVLTITGAAAALGQTGQAGPHKNDKRNVVPARDTVDPRPPEQKWVEDTIDKLLVIPNDLFNPPPARH